MNLLKKIGLAGVTLAALAGLFGKAEAMVINIAAKTSDTTNVGVSPNLSFRTDGSTSSSFDPAFDTKNPSLEISSNDPGYRASIVGAPRYTNQFTFDLAIGPYTDSKITTGPLNEIITFRIPDNTDLFGKAVIAYDLENSSLPYVIPNNNSKYPITLINHIPNNQSGVFDHWRIAIVPIGDTNLDGIVDASDYTTLKNNFGRNPATWQQGDFSGNGSVDWDDLQMLMGNFGTRTLPSPAPASSAPEPATLGLLALGGLAAGLARGKKR